MTTQKTPHYHTEDPPRQHQIHHHDAEGPGPMTVGGLHREGVHHLAAEIRAHVQRLGAGEAPSSPVLPVVAAPQDVANLSLAGQHEVL